jgi:ComF family protein
LIAGGSLAARLPPVPLSPAAFVSVLVGESAPPSRWPESASRLLDLAADGLLGLVFPDQCVACGVGISRRVQHGVCASCRARVDDLELAPPWCPSCGTPAAGGTGDVCIPCLLESPPYSAARSFGYYRDELRSLIHALKFHNRRDLGHVLGPRLAAACLATWRPEELDLIVPVPLHSSRERRRGYNQSALLARAVAPELGVAFAERVLVRVAATLPQVGLSVAERRSNVRGAFRVRDAGSVKGRRVLLVDDVFTTGATAGSAAQALLRAGALRVSVATVARAVEID